MLRGNERIFSNIQKLSDFLISFICWSLIYYFYSRNVNGFQAGLDSIYLKMGFFLGLINSYFFTKYGLYQSLRLSRPIEEVQKIFMAHAMSVAGFVILAYLVLDIKLSRSLLLTYFLVGGFLLSLWRLSVRYLLYIVRSKGKNLRHYLLVGNGDAINHFVENIKSYPHSGIKFTNWIDSNGSCEKYQIKCGEEDITTVLSQSNPDAIIIGYSGQDSAKSSEVIRKIHNDVIPVVVLPDITYSFVGYSLDFLAGVPALLLNQPNFSTFNLALKRLFDIFSSGLGLVLISPLLILISIGVKLSSSGPIFFAQERIGLDGKKFKMWKFRSMRVDAEAVATWTTKDDPRKTPFGSLLRATSLDELPQLWNVFIGDMSLVGPRPEQPKYVEKFKHEIPAYMLRHKMKAGITGWAQVNGWRGDTSLHRRIECDLYYIRHWSLWLDIKILFLTFWKGFINKNAY